MARWYVVDTKTTRCLIYLNLKTMEEFICGDMKLDTSDQELVDMILTPEMNPCEGDQISVGSIQFVIGAQAAA